ncbi:hypothetical protein PINS_up018549 [Pythium insidiosum]|nr:hypothetical protein PINS_up018549 [Pythium insidiosum]
MIAVTRDELWGVVPEGLENNYRIVWTPVNGTEDWHMLSELMSAWWVATDGSTVCDVCQRGGYLECTLDKNKSYDRIFDRSVVLTEVGVVNGMIYGLNKDGSPYVYGSPEFPSSNGPFRSIGSDGDVMCAVSKTTSSAQCTSKGQDKWVEIGGNLSQICVCDRQLYGVAADGTLWTKQIELPSTVRPTSHVNVTKWPATITSCKSTMLPPV